LFLFFIQVHPLNPREDVELIKPYGEVIEAELEKVETLLKACEGVDTILHLAGEAHPNARWESLLKNNIEGYSFS
jgi:nucleoside-diphosphate-sugar epimerase